MKDNPLIQLLISTIQDGLNARSIVASVQQSYQPTQQGAPSTPTVTIVKITDKRYGWTKRVATFDINSDLTTHTETQVIETGFQVNAYAIQDPANTTQLTASDYLKSVAMILQNSAVIASLFAQTVGILRIDAIRNVKWTDDRVRYEDNPSFDFMVSHEDVDTTVINSAGNVGNANITVIS